jgi:hypothetical protein
MVYGQGVLELQSARGAEKEGFVMERRDLLKAGFLANHANVAAINPVFGTGPLQLPDGAGARRLEFLAGI